MRIGLAQINPTVGDITGNARLIVDRATRAVAQGAELVVFPELCLTGYPPLDLLFDDAVIDAVDTALQWIQQQVPSEAGVLFGAPVRNPSETGKRLYNAAILLEKDRDPQTVRKMLLPTYDIYDEYRYFEPAESQPVVEFRGLRLGVHLCEDMWNDPAYATYHTYEVDPLHELAGLGIDLFVNLSASPYSHDRPTLRSEMLAGICRRFETPFLLVNQVGANTELIFDGGSLVHRADGSLAVRAKLFEEDLLVWDSSDGATATGSPSASSERVSSPAAPDPPGQSSPSERSTRSAPGSHQDLAPKSTRIRDAAGALTLGIRDYVDKSALFSKALIGLSGGIDSAVTAALAVRALGADHVVGVTMPSRFSSEHSVEDSRSLALNLGIEFHEIPILPAVRAYNDMLSGPFAGTPQGLAEENIQARSRGLVLMALSNKFGYLLLATGNKSEMAMGYATLYGDMAGGLGVLSDLYKTEVYDLAHFLNAEAGRNVIPASTLEKPPSAELRPDQKDQDTLPPYPVLDEILRLYIEERLDEQAIADQAGHDVAFVRDILRVVDRNEYKRRQAAPGLRLTTKAFGPGRRIPVVMHFDRESTSAMKMDLTSHQPSSP